MRFKVLIVNFCTNKNRARRSKIKIHTPLIIYLCTRLYISDLE
uniref:Uncharacterized protein n=1 Tax=Meloidogyne enterolobii TaxID=390850 RepID=A0A6V7UAP8_MELEN|nr:unnamed protein product [Meloidogyne enterolobii]